MELLALILTLQNVVLKYYLILITEIFWSPLKLMLGGTNLTCFILETPSGGLPDSHS